MKKKYPDNIVFDYEKENYDSNVKISQQQLEPKF